MRLAFLWTSLLASLALGACGGSNAARSGDAAGPFSVGGTTGGGGGAGGGAGGNPSAQKQAFVSYAMVQGDVGLAAADTACNEDGTLWFTGRNFVAFLSTSTESALARIGDGPWWVGGSRLGSPSDLASNTLGTALKSSPTGSVFATGEYVWTGTASGGIVAAAQTCADWTTKSNTVTGQLGQIGYNLEKWTASTIDTCDHEGHLYCFER